MRRYLPTVALTLALVAASACNPSKPVPGRVTQPAGAPAGAPTLPPAPAFVTLTGLVSAPSRLVAAGGGNIVAAGSGNIIAAAGGNMVAAGGGNIVGNAGGNIVGNAGGNIVGNAGGNMVAAGGGNVIVNNGGNMVAAGGGNMVAAGGGNLVQFGARMVAAGGGNMVAAGGGNVIVNNGGNMVAAGGGNMVAAGGGNYRLDAAPRRKLNAIEMSPIAQTPVVGARVLLTDAGGQAIDIPATFTDADGHYTIPAVPGGARYIVTVVVGDESAALSARTYGLTQTGGGTPSPRQGESFNDLANPLVIGIALPGEENAAATPAPAGTDDPAPLANVSAEDRDDLFLKTFASADRQVVEADVTLATTVILEALVLANGTRRDDVRPEQWREAVARLTPLIREINPRSLPKELLDAPIVDAIDEPARAREILQGWTVLRPELVESLLVIEQILFATPAPDATPEANATPEATPAPAGQTPAATPQATPAPEATGESVTSGGSGGSDGAEDDEEEIEPVGTLDLTPGGYASPAQPPTILIGGP